MGDDFAGKFKATQMFDEIVYIFRSNMPVKTTRTLMHTFPNSFNGKTAVDFLLEEVPHLVPDKQLNRENVCKLLQMMLEWKVIADPLAKKKAKKQFEETKLYVFQVSLSDIRAPKPRSRRSASFSGVRKSMRVSTSQEDVREKHREEIVKYETVGRTPQKKMRRMSRSNGNIEKIASMSSPKVMESTKITTEEPKGLENAGFDEHGPCEEVCPGIDEQSEVKASTDGLYTKKERNYDWLPFFKSKRYMEKQKQSTHENERRSISLDRNHHALQHESTHLMKITMSPPPRRKSRDDDVIMHPKGLSPVNNLSRTKLYESFARRPSPVIVRQTLVWKTELIKRFTSVIGQSPPKEWCVRIDAHDIQWNASSENTDSVDGVVRSKVQGPQPDYPLSVIQFMEYLGRYPFSKKTELMQSQKDAKIFGTLVNRLGDLNSPLLSDEATIMIDLLKKHDSFSAMFEFPSMKRFSKNSIDEPAGLMAEEFSHALPVCGIRASMHRRRTISPLDYQSVQDCFGIKDESFYKLRESWLIEAFQLILIGMQTSRRRKLHKFVLFMRSLATNEVLNIADPSNGWMSNREAIIVGLWKGIVNFPYKKAGIVIAAVLLANYRILFAIPDVYIENVQALIPSSSEPTSLYAKVTRGRKLARNNDKFIESKMPLPIREHPQKEEKKPSLLNRLLKR